MTGLSERAVQRSILKLCGALMPDVFITHVPNGAHLAGSNIAKFKQMGALKGDGLKPGFPDLLCLWSGGAALIEVKREKGGVISDAQKTLHAKLEAIGWPVCIAASAIDAFSHLKALGAPFVGEPE